jgi:hypothetical protein
MVLGWKKAIKTNDLTFSPVIKNVAPLLIRASSLSSSGTQQRQNKRDKNQDK